MKYAVLCACLFFSVHVFGQAWNFGKDAQGEQASDKLKVILKFQVNESGDIDSLYILKGIDSIHNNEALQMFKNMPHPGPAKREGNYVRVCLLSLLHLI